MSGSGVARSHGSDTQVYVAGLLAEARQELTRADAKATTVFAAVGVAIAVVIAAAVQAKVDIEAMRGWQRTGVALIAFLEAVSVFSLGFAVWPRTAKGQEGRLHYFADASVHVNPASTQRDLADHQATDPVRRDLAQLQALEPILSKKYKAVRIGLSFSGLAAAVLSAAMLLPRIF